MKHYASIVATMMAFCAPIAAQPLPGIEAMDRAVKTFLGSDGIKSKSTRWSNGMEEYHFKYTAADEGHPLRQPALEQMAAAFAGNAGHASEAYFHDRTTGLPPFGSVTFSRGDNYFSGIMGSYVFGDSTNFRIVSFPTATRPTTFGMLWHETTFADRHGNPRRTIDGQLFKFYDGLWQMEDFGSRGSRGYRRGVIALSKDDRVRYETLRGQMRYLANLYTDNHRRHDERSNDATAYFLQKLCSGYEGTLTEPMYQELKQDAEPFLQLTDSSLTERRRIIDGSLQTLHRQVKDHSFSGHVTVTETGSGTFGDPDDDQRVLRKEYDFGMEPRPQVRLRLKGCCAPAATAITITRKHPKQMTYQIDAADGHFDYSALFDRDQLLELSDGEGHSMTIFADSVATEIDLTGCRLKGSPQNERMAACQHRLRDLQREEHCYVTDFNGYGTVVDGEGFRRLEADGRRLIIQMAAAEKNSLVPAWLLAENYYTMSLDELRPLMQRSLPYAGHAAMQPVWRYYEGLQRRPVGGRLVDAHLTDTAKVSRRLSEFIGRGQYTVLCFWNMSSRRDLKTLKALKKAYEGRRLNIVCVTLDPLTDSWKKYVRKRDLRFIHLQAHTDSKRDGWQADVVKEYGITTLPETIVYDPQGRIIARGLCGQRLTDFLKDIRLAQE